MQREVVFGTIRRVTTSEKENAKGKDLLVVSIEVDPNPLAQFRLSTIKTHNMGGLSLIIRAAQAELDLEVVGDDIRYVREPKAEAAPVKSDNFAKLSWRTDLSPTTKVPYLIEIDDCAGIGETVTAATLDALKNKGAIPKLITEPSEAIRMLRENYPATLDLQTVITILETGLWPAEHAAAPEPGTLAAVAGSTEYAQLMAEAREKADLERGEGILPCATCVLATGEHACEQDKSAANPNRPHCFVCGEWETDLTAASDTAFDGLGAERDRIIAAAPPVTEKPKGKGGRRKKPPVVEDTAPQPPVTATDKANGHGTAAQIGGAVTQGSEAVVK